MSTDQTRELLKVLKLETIEDNLFRGANENRRGFRLFGGQVLAQALAAADQTLDGSDAGGLPRPCHSLHGYFLRPGDSNQPVLYRVERIRDGRSFTTRRIVAIQKGEAIFSMDASFQVREEGLSHQEDMPDFPEPESLEDDNVVSRRLAEEKSGDKPISRWALRERAFDFRSVFLLDKPGPDEYSYPVWLRFREKLPDDHSLHQYLLAYASDMGFISTSILPHREVVKRDKIQMASLDHALWFHRDFRVDDWILYMKETVAGGGSRGYNRGAFYTRDGVLIASAMQEGLMRVRS